MCKNVILATLKYNCGGQQILGATCGNTEAYPNRFHRTQWGDKKKGSIDAILLSIEMIEKGFCANRISSPKTHTRLQKPSQLGCEIFLRHKIEKGTESGLLNYT